MNSQYFGPSAAALIGGLFGNTGAPYQAAQGQYDQSFNQAKDLQNPFYQTGVGANDNLKTWLNNQANPSGFINGLMNQYQESPWARYQQMQSQRAATNAASASGLTGSTPFLQQIQQNASNISGEDMNQWLQNVLGINSQYGAGNQFLSGQGAGSANSLTDLLGGLAAPRAESAYGEERGGQNDLWNTIGGGIGLLSSFF